MDIWVLMFSGHLGVDVFRTFQDIRLVASSGHLEVRCIPQEQEMEQEIQFQDIYIFRTSWGPPQPVAITI